MNDIMLKIDNVSKQYKLGQIGGTTLRDELQRRHAKRRGLEDPTKRIGAKDYNKGETFMALNGISFEVRKGERVGIIGHNGAGKSTLLKLISRVTAPTGGTIGLNGRVASMLEVGTGFHGELTGRENIYMNGAILGMTKKEIDAKIEDIIEFSECRQFIDTPVKRYSSGMYVKLAFSVAAHLDSEIMIMDEVLAVGDMKFQEKCLGKMDDVSKSYGRTILYVSHNMSTIRKLCTRCILLNHGCLVYDGDVESAISQYSGIIEVSPKKVDLSSIERTKFCTEGVKIKSIEILNRTSWRIPFGQKIKAEIIVLANRNLKNINLRLRLACADNTSVSSLIANNIISEIKNGEEMRINVELDISQVIPGVYNFTPALYEVNEFGTIGFYDHMHQAIIFEVYDDDGQYKSFYWKPQFDGNIILPQMEHLNCDAGNENYS